MHAKFKEPMSDCNSTSLTFFLVAHCCKSALSLSNLSWGRRASELTVSSITPKNSNSVAGPLVLPGAIGTPRPPEP